MKLNDLAKHGDLLIRVVAGLIFIIAGYGKLFGTPGIAGFTGMLTGLNIPAAGFMAVIVGIIELLGGIALFLGVYTRISASLLGIIILVAILTVHLKNGWGDYRYPLLLLTVLVRYIGTPGCCDLNSLMKKKHKK